MQVIGETLPDEVQNAIESSVSTDPGQAKAEDIKKGKQLCMVTVGVLGGSVLTMARNVKDPNGWELWRQLAAHYEPARASRALGQLTELINPRVSGPEVNYKDRLTTSVRQTAYYEAQCSKEIDDDEAHMMNYSESRRIWIPTNGGEKHNQAVERLWHEGRVSDQVKGGKSGKSAGKSAWQASNKSWSALKSAGASWVRSGHSSEIGEGDRSHIERWHCGKTGHFVSSCPIWVRADKVSEARGADRPHRRLRLYGADGEPSAFRHGPVGVPHER